MTPERSTNIAGNMVEEFWWAGEFCCYVNNHLSEHTFDEIVKKIKIEEYFKLWEGFDFFTCMSDDYSVTRRGNMEKSRLKEKAGDDPTLLEIHKKFCLYDDPMKGAPKPKVEDYI